MHTARYQINILARVLVIAYGVWLAASERVSESFSPTSDAVLVDAGVRKKLGPVINLGNTLSAGGESRFVDNRVPVARGARRKYRSGR